MKQSAELGQSLCWNKGVQDFEKGEWARQQSWQPGYRLASAHHAVTSSAKPPAFSLVLSCSLPLQGTTVVVLRCHCIHLWVGLAFLFHVDACPTQTILCPLSSLTTTPTSDSLVCAYQVTQCQCRSPRARIPPASHAVPTCRWNYKNGKKVFQELLLDLSLMSERDGQYSVKYMALTMPAMVSSNVGILQKGRIRMQ